MPTGNINLPPSKRFMFQSMKILAIGMNNMSPSKMIYPSDIALMLWSKTILLGSKAAMSHDKITLPLGKVAKQA